MDKNELLAAMSDSYAKLNEQIGKMTDDELNATFQFANDPKNAVHDGFTTNAPAISSYTFMNGRC